MQEYQCVLCKHYILDLKCHAFPGGIPKDILEGKSHEKPIEGDHGIQFEKRQPKK